MGCVFVCVCMWGGGGREGVREAAMYLCVHIHVRVLDTHFFLINELMNQ